MSGETFKSVIEHHIDQINKNELDIRVIQKENEIQTRIFIKFEETVEKMQDLTESMHRLISIHDERINVQTKRLDDIKEDMDKEIKELETRLSRQLSDSETRILEKIEELQTSWKKEENNIAKTSSGLDKLLLKLSSYKWFIAGALIAAGIFLGKSGMVSNIISAIYYLAIA